MTQWIAEHNAVRIFALIGISAAALFSLFVSTTDTALAPFADTKVVLEGVVVRDPDIREKTVRLTVRPERINGMAVEKSKYVVVSVDRFTEVAYGDRITAEGTLRAPESFETDSGRTFNYPKYLWAHGISYELPFATVSVTGKGEGNVIVSGLLFVKRALIEGVERALPEPYSALAEGLLLGEKQSLGDRLYDAFRKAGIVHIIVLSGYNVALVISSVLFIALRILPRTVGYIVAAVFVILFAIMTGGSETTIRATIMALLMMVARVLNRPAAALQGLLIAAAFMALMNPFIVLYDLSFQLSVLATLGLILFSENIKVRLRFLPERFGFREIVATTLATQITVLPLLILSIGAVSLVFLPANALVLAPIPLAMFSSFVAALFTYVSPLLALPFSFFAYVILRYIVEVGAFFGSLPFSIIEIPSNLVWATLPILLIVYGAVFWYFRRKVADARDK